MSSTSFNNGAIYSFTDPLFMACHVNSVQNYLCGSASERAGKLDDDAKTYGTLYMSLKAR